MGFVDVMRVHERQQVIGKLPDGEGGIPPRRFPVAPGVQGIDVILLGEHIDLACEVVAVFTVSVEENQRLSLAFFYVEVLDVHLDWVYFSKVR